MSAANPDDAEDAEVHTHQWRVRYAVGDLAHYTAWSTRFPVVENRFDQLRRSDHAHDAVIERRAVIRR